MGRVEGAVRQGEGNAGRNRETARGESKKGEYGAAERLDVRAAAERKRECGGPIRQVAKHRKLKPCIHKWTVRIKPLGQLL